MPNTHRSEADRAPITDRRIKVCKNGRSQNESNLEQVCRNVCRSIRASTRRQNSISAQLCTPWGCDTAYTPRSLETTGALSTSLFRSNVWRCSSMAATGTAAPSTGLSRRRTPNGGRGSSPKISSATKIRTSCFLTLVGLSSAYGSTKTRSVPRPRSRAKSETRADALLHCTSSGRTAQHGESDSFHTLLDRLKIWCSESLSNHADRRRVGLGFIG